MRIDVHAHAHHRQASYMDMLREGSCPTFGAAHDEATLEKMSECRDEGGFKLQVLSISPNSPYLRDANPAQAAAREVNDVAHFQLAEATARIDAAQRLFSVNCMNLIAGQRLTYLPMICSRQT